MQWVFFAAEWGITALFLWCVWLAWQRRDGGRSLLILFSAALYAFVFEDLNVLQVQGRGSYHYNERFVVFFDHVPMFIVLAWAVILWTAMDISDASVLPWHARVLSDATLAVWLDLAFDATAIRHEFWFWHGVQLDEAWFGVPAGNFFGWLYVSLAFSSLTRALDTKVRHTVARLWLQVLAVPPLAFILYRLIEGATNGLLRWRGWTGDTASLVAFFVVLAGVALAALLMKQDKPTQPPHPNSRASWHFFSRAAFHVFAITGLWVLPANALLQAQRPMLLLIAAVVWLGDEWYQRAIGTGWHFNRSVQS